MADEEEEPEDDTYCQPGVYMCWVYECVFNCICISLYVHRGISTKITIILYRRILNL